jgi:hypothetical protein
LWLKRGRGSVELADAGPVLDRLDLEAPSDFVCEPVEAFLR